MQSRYRCQNNETDIALKYFGANFKGTVMEIGANDGVSLSNSYDLIDMGWKGILVEPSGVFSNLFDVHKDNINVKCIEVAIGPKNGTMVLLESGAHIPNGTDRALVSTLSPNEILRWPNVEFTQKDVTVMDFKTFSKVYELETVDYLSIDVEGYEMLILEQIDLWAIDCKLLCIEWNSIPSLAKQFIEYCAKFGMKEIHRNAENLIFAR